MRKSGAGCRNGAQHVFVFIDVPREKILRDFPFQGEKPTPWENIKDYSRYTGWVEEIGEGYYKYYYTFHEWCGTRRGESYEQRRRKRYYLKQYYKVKG
jgi:hypothetical protein